MLVKRGKAVRVVVVVIACGGLLVAGYCGYMLLGPSGNSAATSDKYRGPEKDLMARVGGSHTGVTLREGDSSTMADAYSARTTYRFERVLTSPTAEVTVTCQAFYPSRPESGTISSGGKFRVQCDNPKFDEELQFRQLADDKGGWDGEFIRHEDDPFREALERELTVALAILGLDLDIEGGDQITPEWLDEREALREQIVESLTQFYAKYPTKADSKAGDPPIVVASEDATVVDPVLRLWAIQRLRKVTENLSKLRAGGGTVVRT